jgi:chromosome segregation ATPase
VNQNGILTLLVALIAVSGVVYTARSNRKASDQANEVAKATEVTARKKVDQDAFDRARAADQETIRNLREEVNRERTLRREDQQQTQSEIAKLERQIEALRLDLSSSHRNEQRLLEHIDKLEATVARLRARLAVAGLLEDRQPPPAAT